MAIQKSSGFSSTEKRLAELCDQTFLKLWAYPNPRQHDGKELCDVLAIFENHIFLFFDRESKKFENPETPLELQWARWQKEAIQKQTTSLIGAKKYVLKHPDKIYLDEKATVPLPVPVPTSPIIHKIIVANGATEACKKASDYNNTGSLAIIYENPGGLRSDKPFLVSLDKSDPVHIFDSQSLETVLNEVDTFFDFRAYITAKETAIAHLDVLCYCGEEDLLCHYFSQYDDKKRAHYIGARDKKTTGIMVEEGIWEKFIHSNIYQRRKEANEISVIWDDLLQRTCQNALDGVLGGSSNPFAGQSAVYDMAMEPRFSRRALSEHMTRSIKNFPEAQDGLLRSLSFMPSFYPDKAYVFLQLRVPSKGDYESDYRPRRIEMLSIACGVTKNKYPHLKKIIGLAIDAPRFHVANSEDFILLNCEEWSDEERTEYEELNKDFRFYESPSLTKTLKTIRDFPLVHGGGSKDKVGRNEKCPCNSGKKYKHCCMNKANNY